jgi:hypothetical protein
MVDTHRHPVGAKLRDKMAEGGVTLSIASNGAEEARRDYPD